MRRSPSTCTEPVLINEAIQMAGYITQLNVEQIMKSMKISEALAEKVVSLYKQWNTETQNQTPAKDAFIGDIYSGLQAGKWDKSDQDFAQKNLRILSGLYGILRPNDGVMPYRMEMGYKLPDPPYSNMYNFWGEKIAKTIRRSEVIINLAAIEYSKTLTEYLDRDKFISPTFLTIHAKTHKPEFVVVHTKIARGAFANWMIENKIEEPNQLINFAELGYVYAEDLSTAREPVFVCHSFGGKGLSVRLNK